MDKTISYFLHGFAGIVIVGAPLISAGIPASWQALTIGAVLALIFKWAHDFAGY